jgi:hypothetical protein
MRKFYGFALCAGLASVLAVVYTLLHLDWEPPADAQPPAAAAPAGAPESTPKTPADTAGPEQAAPAAGSPRPAVPEGASGSR